MDGTNGFRLPPHHLWQQLDTLLDELLALDQTARAVRLDELKAKSPALAARLNRLLDSAGNTAAIERRLSSALESLSGCRELPKQRHYGPWRLIEPLGQGGMARVYRAERADGAYSQEVALKLMWPGLTGIGTSRHFRRERQLLANMNDPRIARLFDGGVSEDGSPWLVMELVDGCPITDFCREQRLDAAQRLSLFTQVTGAVSAAHRRLAVHGDIKPSNVLVGPDGRVKLLDFGIGRLLGAKAEDDLATLALTPRYASPEQLQRRRITTASDIYQLGALLQRMLAEPAGAVPSDHDLLALVDKAMAADTEQRYPSVDGLESDVRAWLEHRPLAARGGGRLYRLGRFVRRNRAGTAATAVAVLLLVGALGVYHRQAGRIAAEAAVSRSVTAFLEDILHAGDPYAAESTTSIPERLLEQAMRRAESELAGQPGVQARIFNVLGEVYRSRGEALRALELFERAGALAKRHDLATERTRSQAGIAAVGIWSGDYARAERTLRAMLTDHRRRYGDAAAITARTRLQLADLLHSRGYYGAAEALTLEVLAGEHEQAWAHRVLGMILRDQGRFEDADRHLAEALERERIGTGPRRDMLAIVLEHYGQLKLHVGEIEAARAMLDEAVALRQDMLGPDWNGLVWTRHWLGLAALAGGEPEAAESLLETTVADYRSAFSDSSHLLAIARSDLGWVQLALERPARAGNMFRSAIRALERIQPGDHPRLAESLMGLALARLAVGDTTSAQAHSARALAIRRSSLARIDPLHPWIVSACRTYRLAGAACEEETESAIESYLDLIKTGAFRHPAT